MCIYCWYLLIVAKLITLHSHVMIHYRLLVFQRFGKRCCGLHQGELQCFLKILKTWSQSLKCFSCQYRHLWLRNVMLMLLVHIWNNRTAIKRNENCFVSFGNWTWFWCSVTRPRLRCVVLPLDTGYTLHSTELQTASLWHFSFLVELFYMWNERRDLDANTKERILNSCVPHFFNCVLHSLPSAERTYSSITFPSTIFVYCDIAFSCYGNHWTVKPCP